MNNYKRLYLEEFINIGVIRRSHGYKGHAKVSIDDVYLDDLKRQKFIFLEIDGYKVPFKIEEFKDERDQILKFKGCSSSEDISKYQLHSLFLLKEDITVDEKTSDYMSSQLVGYELHDINMGNIGRVVRIDEYPQQLMAIVQDSNKVESMIPLHEKLIIETSEELKIITMDLPDGLV